MSKLEDKMALVTGASRGIGRAIAQRLWRDGVLVAVHYGKRREAADETVREIESGSGAAFAVGADLGSLSGVQALYRALAAALQERTGDTQLDIHFNQVGGPRHDPVGRS